MNPRHWLPSPATAKAVASAIVMAAGYLITLLHGDDSLGDLTTAQWLGLVVFMGAGYGVTYAVPNKDRTATRQRESVQPPQ